MARSMNQKLKVLYLIRLLAKTDESHVVTMAEILETLKDHGISAERKSIYDDMGALRFFGLEVVTRRERPAGYYLVHKEKLAELFGMEKVCEKEKTKVPEKIPTQPEWLKGDLIKIELLCREETARTVSSFWGNDVLICKEEKKKSGEVVCKFKARPCVAFYNWLAGFGCRVKLVSPSGAVKGYRKYLKEIRALYKLN